MKRIASLVLTLILILSAVSMTSLAANPFTDVPSGQWYYADVVNAHEMGLINGKTATTFQPDDKLTYAEAVKLAACMHQRYMTGAVTLGNGAPWYQTYVDYCKANKIISADYAWTQPATRAGYMEIFAGALPDSALMQINNIPDGTIPDVPMTHKQSAAIYKLYRAGILQGNDELRSCNPAASIKRSEVAAILTRMMDSSKRLWFSTAEQPKQLQFVTEPSSVEAAEGDRVILTVEVEGGAAPYTFVWYSISNGVNEPIAGIPGVEIYGDSESSRAEILVGGPYDWTTNESFFCVVTDDEGYSITSRLVRITLKEEPKPLTIEHESRDVLLHETLHAFTLTFSGGEGPYYYIWEMKQGDEWVNVRNMDDVELLQNGWELTCKFQTQREDNTCVRCVIFDSLGNSVTSREFWVFIS